MRTLPLLAVFFLPIACGIGYLYLWARPDVVAASPKLQYQQFYLSPDVFLDSRGGVFRPLAGDGLSAGFLVAQGRPDGQSAAGVEEPASSAGLAR